MERISNHEYKMATALLFPFPFSLFLNKHQIIPVHELVVILVTE